MIQWLVLLSSVALAFSLPAFVFAKATEIVVARVTRKS